MPTKSHSTDSIKKSYNEKNPVQPQGVFKPASAENSTTNKKSVAAKLHRKNKANNKAKK